MPKKLAIIGIPSCLGGNKRGCEKGPAVIRKELIPLLDEKQIPFKDYGDVTEPKYCTIHSSFSNCLPEIRHLNQKITEFLHKNKLFSAENFPILLGGDHSVNYSFIKEAAKHKNLGLIWFDAHGDFNTPETSPSGNIHGMVLAALAGIGLNKELGNTQPIIKEENICIIGSRELDPKELELLKQTKVNVFSMKEIETKGFEKVLQLALAKAAQNTNGIHLSFDLDVFDPQIAPEVSTPSTKGLTQNTIHTIAKAIKDPKITSMGITELSPIQKESHGAESSKTAKFAARLITTIATHVLKNA